MWRLRPLLLLLLEASSEEAALRDHHAAPICNAVPRCSGIVQASGAADAQRDCSSGVSARTSVASERFLLLQVRVPDGARIAYSIGNASTTGTLCSNACSAQGVYSLAPNAVLPHRTDLHVANLMLRI